MVVGPWTGAFTALFAPGTKIVGARFRPGYAHTILEFPASALLNQSVPLSDISKNFLNEGLKPIADKPNLSAKRAVIEKALLSRLASSAPADQSMNAAIRWLAQHPHGRVEQLSQWLGLSSRHLQRRFVAAVGYGPKTFQSILRFQRLLRLAQSTQTSRTLSNLAASVGYADQAHMTRDVHRLSGTQPTTLLTSAECTLRWFFKD